MSLLGAVYIGRPPKTRIFKPPPPSARVRPNFQNRPLPGHPSPVFSAIIFTHYFFRLLFLHIFLTPVEILAKYRGLIVLLPIRTDNINSNSITNTCSIFN